MKKRFIVRKYVFANSATEALRLEKKQKADDVWVDEKWDEEMVRKQIGFNEK